MSRFFKTFCDQLDKQKAFGPKPAFQLDPGEGQLALGYLLAHTDSIRDEELKILVDLCINRKLQDRTGDCVLCKGALSTQHLLSCPKCQGATLAMHNSMVYNILSSMPKKRNASATPKKFGQNVHDHFSDGSFEGKDGRRIHIDVTIVGCEADMDARLRQKDAAFAKSGCKDGFIPIVVSYTGKLHPQSLERLQKAAPEITHGGLSRMLLGPLAKGIAAAQKLFNEASVDKLVEKKPLKPVKGGQQRPVVAQGGGGGGTGKPPN